jgi:TPR repeat protein
MNRTISASLMVVAVLASCGGLASAQDDASTQTNLAWRYYSGKGVARDYQEAARLYGLAAAQGHASAQTFLGYMYVKGLGVAQDYKEGARLWGLSAAQGNKSAQNNLGYLYELGQGVAQDYKEAARLYTLSAAQGVEMAQIALARVGTLAAQQTQAAPLDVKPSLEDAKAKCIDLGFKAGTEKFGTCVLKLSK